VILVLESWVEACETTTMKPRLSLVGVVLLAGCLAVLSVAQQKADTTSKIVALENKWADAYKQRDVATMSSMLADDFIITVEDGSTYSKTGYISHSGDTNTQVDVAETTELKIRVHGNVAVATGAYHEKGKTKGKPYEYHDRLTDVWMNIDGRWQVLASHYSIPVK
jgi:ketosteroid isomerase-like protein